MKLPLAVLDFERGNVAETTMSYGWFALRLAGDHGVTSAATPRGCAVCVWWTSKSRWMGSEKEGEGM
jgi:hypothetical protein